MVDGKPFGGKNDIPAYGPDSYPQSGVPEGKFRLPGTSQEFRAGSGRGGEARLAGGDFESAVGAGLR
jgi:hypothetical protein